MTKVTIYCKTDDAFNAVSESKDVIANTLLIPELDVVRGAPDMEEVPVKLKINYELMGPAFRERTKDVVEALHKMDINELYEMWKLDDIWVMI